MRTTRLIAAAATIAAMALSAASAQAASFTPNNGQNTTITGTVTWKKPGSAPINCTLTWARTTLFWANQSPPCNGQTMQGNPYMVAPSIDGQGNDRITAAPYISTGSPTPFPGVAMNAMHVLAPFFDGNATTASTIILNDTLAGYANGGAGNVTWTGTLTMTQTATGGLVTIVP